MIRALLALSALASSQLPPREEGPKSLLESHGPLSASARDDRDKTVVFLGGILLREHEDSYRRFVNSGGDPEAVAGPERIHYGQVEESGIVQLKTVFHQLGFHLSDPSSFRPLGSRALYLFFTRGPNQIAEKCRRAGESLRSCTEYLQAREIGLALSDDEGRSWNFQGIVAGAKDSGDGSGPAQPAALYVGDEVWLYYTTGNQSFMKENIFRLRLSLDGKKRLADPEPVRISGFAPGLSLANVQLVRLRCEEGGKFVVTMVANNRAMTALPMFLSGDGLLFKPVADSLVSSAGGSLIGPTQMPGPASAEECSALRLSGVSTYRELFYAEQIGASWFVRRVRAKVVLP